MTELRHLSPPRLTRRHLLAGSGAVVASAGLAGGALGQEASPVAIDLEAFRVTCAVVTGVDDPALLDDAGLEQLLGLFLEDEEMTSALQQLLATDLESPDFDFRAIDFSLLVVVTNILQFWHLGNFRNAPLENRAERYPGLVSWSALPYVTNQTVCKGFGYWSLEA
jgi:hypothetical protein